MTKNSIFIFLFNALWLSSFGQTQDHILTKAQNDKWLDSINTLSLDNRLQSIRNRVLSDTNVFVRQYYADRIRVVDSLGNRVYSDGKPTLIISGYPMYIDNKTKTIRIIGLTNLLTETYIKDIEILSPNDPATLALYGSSGQFGIIIMTLTKKKYSRQFKRLSQNP
jgi:hypothetical protein